MELLPQLHPDPTQTACPCFIRRPRDRFGGHLVPQVCALLAWIMASATPTASGRGTHPAAAELWADKALEYLRVLGSSGNRERVHGVETPIFKIKGDVTWHRDDSNAAIKFYAEALARGSSSWRPWVLTALAHAESTQGHFERAGDLLGQADAAAAPNLKALIRRPRGELIF